jgi:hemerythrin
MLFKWKDSYSCSISEIDNQHKKLFEIGSRIFSVASLKDGYDHYDEIMDILNELKDYTIYHFSYEEKLMETHNYENYESHKIEHAFFVKKLMRLEKKDFEGDQNEALMDIITFVADWISGHILKTDMKYKSFFNNKGIC